MSTLLFFETKFCLFSKNGWIFNLGIIGIDIINSTKHLLESRLRYMEKKIDIDNTMHTLTGFEMNGFIFKVVYLILLIPAFIYSKPVFILLLVLGFVLYHVRIIPQAKACVIERLGAYHKTWQTGLHILMPIVDRIAAEVSLKEIVLDFEPQPVITKDNVTMQIDTVVYCQIMDPKLYAYGVERPISALGNITATTLRNIVGDLELDETLTSRDTINVSMRNILDEATDPWGIKVTRVEIKNILPPKDIQDSMEKQMRAERERREKILQAEGEKKSNVLIAEGEKEAMMLRAEAKKAAMIAEAEAKAESMRKVAEANAEAIRLINDANPTQQYLTLQSFEALAKVANGQATKLIIPSEIQDVAATLAALSETVKSK